MGCFCMKKNCILSVFFICNLMFSQLKHKEIIVDIEQFGAELNTNPSLAFQYITRACKNSIAIKNDSLIARCYCNLSCYYYSQNNSVASKKECLKAISFAKKNNYKKVLCYSYNQLGLIASEEDKFDKSLQWYLDAMRIMDTDELAEIKSKVLLNLGNLYIVQKDTLKGLQYYNDNIENAKKYALDNELSKAYICVAIVNVASHKQIASQYYFKAMAIVKKNNDLATEFIVHIGLSELYLSDKNSIKSRECLYHLQKAFVIQKLLKDELKLFNLSFNYGGYYLKKKQYTTSLQYYYKALEVTKKNITSDQKLNLYDAISKCYIYNNDYKNGLLFKEKFNSLKDSIFNVNKINTFSEIETKYNVDKKNLKIKLLTKDKELQLNTKRTIIFISLILLLASIVIVLYLRQRIKIQKILSFKKQKIYNQEIIRLEQEKELKRINGILEGQDIERNRFAKEIHDGIGGSLAGIKLQLSLENEVIKNEKIDIIINNMANSFNELRSISHNLSDNFMQDKSLDVLVYQLTNEYKNRGEFEIEMAIYPQECLNLVLENIKKNIYRIVQELFANISKHATASKVSLSFTKHKNILNIILEDDGVGFKNQKEYGIGLKNIIERISSLNGFIKIESDIGLGTTIIMDIPVYE